MAELALGIVGVVPVVLGAITAYKHVTVKVKLFRHSFKEVKRMYKILRTQRQVFSNECLLWLEFVINDSDVASAMASDPGHEGWNDPRLDSTFQSRLKDNYEPWLEVTKEIAEAVHSIENHLEALGKSTELCEVDGKFKRTLKRTRNSLNVALDLGDLEKTIDGLRCSNNELRGLREQVTEIHKPKSTPSPRAKAFEKGEWAGLIKIRRASKALYEALEQTWNCCQPEHLGHSVKLFVETHKLLGEVQMQLAIICRKKVLDLVQPAFFQLEVRSQNLEWIEQPYFQRSNDGPSAPHKRLRLAGISDAVLQPNLHDREITSTGDTEQSDKCGSYDLGSSMDICKELTQKLGVTCLGHLDVRSDEAFRHSFYEARETIFSRPLQLSSADHEAVGMDEILEESSENSLATIDRLKLARSLVSAVLKLHSTPWLSEFWGLQDLSFFKGHEVNISEILRTLHVGVEVAQNRLDSMESLRTFSGSSSLPQVSEDDKLFCGIGNLTLHSLGVALLQIDRWTKVEPCDVLKVRKMALRTSSLGPRYQEITHKCLRCDFGYGSDLTKPRLQEAVYDNVVGALEKMISSLELTED